MDRTEPGHNYEHWREMAADMVNHFWFTNREAGILLAHIDRLQAQAKEVLNSCPECKGTNVSGNQPCYYCKWVRKVLMV